MNKPNLANLARSVRTSVVKHSPEILVGLGISGMIATTVLAVRATPKALHILDEKAREEQRPVEEFTNVEKVKACWKCYIPAAITGVTSAACIIGANSVNTRRNAALAAAYTLSDTALREYQEKVVETIGEKKERVVREKIAEDKIKNNPVSNNGICVTRGGDMRCYDLLSGRYFKSDIEKIKKAVNELNHTMLTDMGGYVSLNDFYDELDLSHTDIGDTMGWCVPKGLIEVEFSAHLGDDGEPCLAMSHKNPPVYGYDSFM